jgi:peroxiredoxin
VKRSTAIAFAVLCAAVPVPASAGKASNPAFLGIGMEDAGGSGPCTITTIEEGSGAEAALLQAGDAIERLDAAPVGSCDALVGMITSRAPGTVIRLDVRRHGQPLKLKAELLTRDEILRRRLVGQPMPATELLRVEDRALVDLSAVKRTTIVAWYPTSCGGCDAALGAVARWSRERKDRRAPVDVVAATADISFRRSTAENFEQLRLVQRSLDLPLLVADYGVYLQFAMKDGDRVHFLVIDARGVVQYVAPVVPEAEDAGAALDELYAAAEQAARRTSR